MKRARTTAAAPRPAAAPAGRRSAEIVVPIEGGGSVSVQGKTAEIRDAEGRVLVRFAGGTAEIAAPDGDLVLSAPRGRVVVHSSQEVAISAGQARETPQLRVGAEAVSVAAEQVEVKTGAGRLVADQASLLAHRITTTATTVSYNVERFELAAGQIVERARDAFRDITDLSQTRAGRVRTIVKDLYSLYSKRTALQSTEETSVDGSKVLLGDAMIKMPAATKKGGMCHGMPNVCFIPAPPPVNQVPVPFPSIGLLAATDGAVDKVLVEHKETVVQGSKIPNSKGDEPGVKKGVISQTQSKEVIPKQFSSKVYFGGKKAYFLTAMSSHNGTSPNLPVGAHVSPSQVKVLVGL